MNREYTHAAEISAEADSQTIKSWKYEGPPGEKGQVAPAGLLRKREAAVGSSYVLQAFCQDFSPTNNTGKSQPVTLQVRSLDELTIAENDPANAAFAALEKAIEAHQTALGITKNLLTNLDDVIIEDRPETQNVESLRRHQSELSKRQNRVGMHMTEAWDVSTPPRPGFVDKLIVLRDGEHARVMEKITELPISDFQFSIGNRQSQIENSSSNKMRVSRSLQSVEKLQVFLLDQECRKRFYQSGLA